LKHPHVTIRISDRVFEADARIVEGAEEDALARRLLRDKYADPEVPGSPDWIVTALPVAFDLVGWWTLLLPLAASRNGN
jgi:hypothetical protein